MDWISLLAAIVTGALAVAVVWWQERSATRKVTALLERYASSFRSSSAIRGLVTQPAEGRWAYSADFQTFFGIESEQATDSQFVSRGVAAIQWHNGVYNILLGYSNRDNDGNKIAASVNTGVLRPMQEGSLQAGDRLRMTYVHRVGLRQKIGDTMVDARDPREDSYVFEIRSVQTNESGELRSFDCALLEHATSSADIRFTREF